ncbi:ABC transporter substrate-binding protein [Salinibacterium sp. dk2585]|uniref:ABC transporter substrate-binding protein n=1 Tax=unclassified Salinibacterium TaxID=2632331 RepID=UPI0011C246AB|nr:MULTISPECIES: ABC transporter substrate-binding protein [unclassified Salinibacterium]QEE60356.1 ABC transporter substrate-binding protein [Salinibacterium sp. dk2585]TXK55429.1 ABC transporter substrate-binding protein [Salinibacterium sp. dk5596]
MKTFRPLIAVAAGALLVLTGCVGTGSSGESGQDAGVSTTPWGAQVLERGEPQRGGSLTYGLSAVVESLDPAGSAVSGNLIMRSIYGVLFSYDDEERNIRPDMAESIESEDGANWTLKLKPGYTFTDGNPYDAEAVKAHFERIAAEGSRSRSAEDMRQITSMEVADEHTLLMTLKKPWTGFPDVLVGAYPGGPAMVPSPAAVEKYGEALATNPVGAGPFMLKSFQPGGDVVLVNNPDYAGDEPYLDEIKFVTATDTQSRVSAALAGDIDIARAQSAVDLETAADGGLTMLTQPDSAYYNLLLNLTAPPFDDERMRRALAHAIDLNGLNAAVFEGKHDPMSGLMLSTSPFFVDTDWPSYDVDKAKELAEEYTADTGNPAAFSLTTTSPPEFQQQAAVLQQMLADAGIDMSINVSDQPTMVSEARAGNFQAQHRYIEIIDVNYARTAFFSTSGGNNGLKGDPTVDRILDEMLTASEGEMKELYVDLQVALEDWLPQVPLIAVKNGVFVSDRVGGYPGNLIGLPEPDFRHVWAVPGS